MVAIKKVLTASAIAGIAVLQGCKAPAPTAAPVVTVPVATAEAASLENNLVLSAEFRPFQEVDVMAKVAGYVRAINVDIGSHVQQNAVLATLEVPEIQDDVAKARAGVAAAEANVITAQAAIQRAQAGANIASLSFQRIKDVAARDQGLVPRQEIDVAQSKQLESSAQLAGANSSLRAAEQQKLQAESEYARTVTMMQYATIRAPFTGVVTKRFANTGSMIQAGTSSQTQAMPVVTLAQNDRLRLTLPIPVNAVSDVRDGQTVDVEVGSLHRTLQGKVSRTADSIQMATRTMNTEVDVPNPDGSLVPGMYAEVHLHLANRPAALSVPLDAVDGLGTSVQQVYTVRDGVIHQVSVKVGLQTANRVEILSGLNTGDKVIVGRHTGLSDGQKVDPQPAAYESATSH
ncbi:RND family efflux transporter, MFP subunit [Terriglobus roseus DSM 18391]|uniref:RND family efflux transporter, MFP subunit n=1 Tax=Terriglobus roseus (strain DSM 18391 / NRRL B-41598 / KBS 63) TaxID=926566 RepID=I3ZI76_TERRK|nr:efflux RND transporter periplasmic adaptor subunit [Terriglobus roseus]AFL88944.1 RND family efflux transporter, MFP subunit [Terriglobus roseus DSM 18391]